MRGRITIKGEGRETDKATQAPDLARIAEKLDLVLAILNRPPWWKKVWRRMGGRK
jgi:hypothetical protein